MSTVEGRPTLEGIRTLEQREGRLNRGISRIKAVTLTIPEKEVTEYTLDDYLMVGMVNKGTALLTRYSDRLSQVSLELDNNLRQYYSDYQTQQVQEGRKIAQLRRLARGGFTSLTEEELNRLTADFEQRRLTSLPDSLQQRAINLLEEEKKQAAITPTKVEPPAEAQPAVVTPSAEPAPTAAEATPTPPVPSAIEPQVFSEQANKFTINFPDGQTVVTTSKEIADVMQMILSEPKTTEDLTIALWGKYDRPTMQLLFGRIKRIKELAAPIKWEVHQPVGPGERKLGQLATYSLRPIEQVSPPVESTSAPAALAVETPSVTTAATSEEEESQGELPEIPTIPGITTAILVVVKSIWPTFEDPSKGMTNTEWGDATWPEDPDDIAKKNRISVYSGQAKKLVPAAGLEIVRIPPPQGSPKNTESKYYIRKTSQEELSQSGSITAASSAPVRRDVTDILPPAGARVIVEGEEDRREAERTETAVLEPAEVIPSAVPEAEAEVEIGDGKLTSKEIALLAQALTEVDAAFLETLGIREGDRVSLPALATRLSNASQISPEEASRVTESLFRKLSAYIQKKDEIFDANTDDEDATYLLFLLSSLESEAQARTLLSLPDEAEKK